MIDQTLLVNNLGDEGSIRRSRHSIRPKMYRSTSIHPASRRQKDTASARSAASRRRCCCPAMKDAMKELDEIQIPESELELAGLTERTERTVDITEYLPDGVTLVDPNANNVVVMIPVNQPGAQVFEVSTNSIVVSNLASYLEVSYGTHRRSGTADPGTGRNPSEPDTGQRRCP